MVVGTSASGRARLYEKSARAFRTIGEVAIELDVETHTLRFWEGQFRQVRPVQRAGARRYYRPEDVDLLRRIRSLLYEEGYSIKGVKRLLNERRSEATPVATIPGETPELPAPIALPSKAKLNAAKRVEMKKLLKDLEGALAQLRHVLGDKH